MPVALHAVLTLSFVLALALQDDLAVLVDLASCTRYGEALHEFTPQFSLGLPAIASLSWYAR